MEGQPKRGKLLRPVRGRSVSGGHSCRGLYAARNFHLVPTKSMQPTIGGVIVICSGVFGSVSVGSGASDPIGTARRLMCIGI